MSPAVCGSSNEPDGRVNGGLSGLGLARNSDEQMAGVFEEDGRDGTVAFRQSFGESDGLVMQDIAPTAEQKCPGKSAEDFRRGFHRGDEAVMRVLAGGVGFVHGFHDGGVKTISFSVCLPGGGFCVRPYLGDRVIEDTSGREGLPGLDAGDCRCGGQVSSGRIPAEEDGLVTGIPFPAFSDGEVQQVVAVSEGFRKRMFGRQGIVGRKDRDTSFRQSDAISGTTVYASEYPSAPVKIEDKRNGGARAVVSCGKVQTHAFHIDGFHRCRNGAFPIA